MKKEQLTYQLEDDNAKDRYVFQFLFQTLGVQAREVSSEPDIYYGTNVAGILYLKREPSSNFRALTDEEIAKPTTAQNHDLIRAIALLLTDEIHADSTSSDFDEHGRLLAERSIPNQINLGDTPLVNQYIKALESALKNHFEFDQIPLWPEGKSYAIALSHDVDVPEKHDLLYNPYAKAFPPIRWFNYAMKWRGYFLDPNKNDNWLFDDIIEEEKKYGFVSTFFFPVRHKYEKNGSARDVSFNIRNKKFKAVINRLKQEGFEIGLHTSYKAYQNLTHFKKERQLLQEVANDPVVGNRHHFYHMGANPEKTLQYHEEAGFSYDSSIAYAESCQLRRSVALPYYPFLSEKKRGSKSLQIPLWLMDSHLFDVENPSANNVNEGMNRFDALLSTLKNYGGLGSINWHVRTAAPGGKEFDSCGQLYFNILKRLANDKEAWVTSLGNITQWVNNRNIKLRVDE